MKTMIFFFAGLLSLNSIGQTEKKNCSDLPMARPEVKASVSVEEVTTFFESAISERLKVGTHSAVYKVFVDCNGDVTQATYQRGTFDREAQLAYKQKLHELKWKPASQASQSVSSVVFVSLEIVNGKLTVVIQ